MYVNYVHRCAGTGKTTIARRVGTMFQQLGILATDQVVECSAGDFVTGYVNQSAGETRKMFQKALGGVLFIDEAYRYAHTKGPAPAWSAAMKAF